MASVNLKDLDAIKEDLDLLKDDEVIFVNDESESHYVIMPIGLYDYLDSFRQAFSEENLPDSNVQILAGNKVNVTYEEYEAIKKQLIKLLDDTLKPKPEKLN